MVLYYLLVVVVGDLFIFFGRCYEYGLFDCKNDTYGDGRIFVCVLVMFELYCLIFLDKGRNTLGF